eukprot:TRINITY_DN6191_c0_g1_i4.p3 TRINITY_DN6191_c0_g1~~TRINITY_DN6191_c0_g1_i4.p3  ORF type:complete len:128 (-),score=39.51 TRINITY_DN6191_c0_g1_i4:76-459(-)
MISSLDFELLSRSTEDLIECIIDRKNKTKSTSKPVPKPEPSKTKPSKIAKGISLIDLNSWFLTTELIAFCEENSLSKGGSKRELAKRIYEHLEGQTSVKSKKKKRKESETTEKGKTDKKRKTTTTKK